MLFKKGVLPNQKDLVAENYSSELQEFRKKLKEKTDEVKKCLKARRANIDVDCDINTVEDNGNTDTAL